MSYQVRHTSLSLYSFLVIFITSCASPEKAAFPNQTESITKKQQSENANVFDRKGQYESESSFQRRQEAAAKADDFFARVGRENCVVKISVEHTCYRAIDNGYYQIYSNGVIQNHGRWKRHNNAFCAGIHTRPSSCKPVTDYKIQSYSAYKNQFPGPEDDRKNVDIKKLRNKRVDLIVRSMTCHKCVRGHWQSSIKRIFEREPNCAFELNKHKVQYGALDINNVQIAVTDTDEDDSVVFLTAVETPDPKHKTKVFLSLLEVQKSEVCNPKFDLIKKL